MNDDPRHAQPARFPPVKPLEESTMPATKPRGLTTADTDTPPRRVQHCTVCHGLTMDTPGVTRHIVHCAFCEQAFATIANPKASLTEKSMAQGAIERARRAGDERRRKERDETYDALRVRGKTEDEVARSEERSRLWVFGAFLLGLVCVLIGWLAWRSR